MVTEYIDGQHLDLEYKNFLNRIGLSFTDKHRYGFNKAYEKLRHRGYTSEQSIDKMVEQYNGAWEYRNASALTLIEAFEYSEAWVILFALATKWNSPWYG